ncbi:MAG TPA: cytochrome bc complex cytochrome b subunit [Candidatus Dormibacteraeota bacterium]|nr:cytochrome bc complex cytochrome b subunit [Candidatus Dormibacteraeota bacterium]
MSTVDSERTGLRGRAGEVYGWIDERAGTTELLHKGLYEAVPRKGGWAYTLGSATLVLILLQLFTGIFLLLEYVPSFQQAWISLDFLQHSDRFGAAVRGMHLWGAYTLILIIGLHMMRTFLSASYKRPRELNWVSGALLFFLVLGLAVTGAMLPMDNAGYWTLVVVTNIPHYIPFIGTGIRTLWRGGDFVGPIALTRTFAIHIWVLPFLMFALIGGHLALLRRHGEFGAWVNYSTSSDDPEREITGRIRAAEPPYPTKRIERRYAAPRETVNFFPFQLGKDVMVSIVLVAVIFVMAFLFGAPLDERADPSTLTYTPTPEWFYLPLDQLLVFIPTTWLIGFGIFVLMGAAATLFTILPFIDRSTHRRPLERPEVLLPGLFFAAMIVMLAVLGITRLYNL